MFSKCVISIKKILPIIKECFWPLKNNLQIDPNRKTQSKVIEILNLYLKRMDIGQQSFFKKKGISENKVNKM